jgi:hypothetical protein
MNSEVATSSRSRAAGSVSALIGLVVAFAWPLVLAIPGVSTRRITDVHAVPDRRSLDGGCAMTITRGREPLGGQTERNEPS